MPENLYNEFVFSGDTLRIYQDRTLVFNSKKEGLLPLMEYLGTQEIGLEPVVLYDKVMGNAAGLLAVKANVVEAYSPLGSELAIKTLDKYGVKYRLEKTVPYIMRDDGKDICPMERLSMGKEPGEFYEIMKARIEGRTTG